MEVVSEVLVKKKNLNYLKLNKRHMLKESKEMCKLLHQRIIELEFELQKDHKEQDVRKMIELLKVKFIS
jgi:hypothetical protein